MLDSGVDDVGSQIRPDLAARYGRETARLFARRLAFTLFLFLSLLAILHLIEWVLRPDRGEQLLRDLSVQVGVACTGLGICALWPHPRVVRGAGILLIAYFVTTLVFDPTLIASRPPHVAMWLVCMLTGTAVLLPWGGVSQAVVAVVALGAFSITLPPGLPTDDALLPALGLAIGATSSIFGARFLDQYRRATFMHNAMLREEADIAAALAHTGEILSTNLNRPSMLESVNQLAVELIGCDWSGTFAWHERPRGYRLAASFGLRPDARTELAMLEFPSEVSPLLQALRPGTLVEVVEGHNGRLVPAHLRRRFEMESALFAPLFAGTELAGVLVCTFRTPRRRFTERERRLALGIAHATAIAHQNATLIHDLTAASRLKSDFVATMSHELRTPLNIILGYTELLLNGEFGDLAGGQREVLTTARRSAQQLFELVSATLSLNRMEAGRDPVQMTVVQLDELFGEIMADLKPLVAAGVELRGVNHFGAQAVVTDRVKLKTIVKNLVGNALKFTAQGSVELVAHRRAGQMVIEVRDTGVGIAEDHLPVIFEMFRQVDSSPTRRHDGVGLGLHIVKRLVDVLGGTILVASTPGFGSTFTVSLPLTTASYQIAS